MSAPTLTTDLSRPEAVPYFLWNAPMTVAELRRKLKTAPEPERIRLIARILREARDTDVWLFVTPAELVRLWPRVATRLGRRRSFWEFLLARWREAGLVTIG